MSDNIDVLKRLALLIRNVKVRIQRNVLGVHLLAL